MPKSAHGKLAIQPTCNGSLIKNNGVNLRPRLSEPNGTPQLNGSYSTGGDDGKELDSRLRLIVRPIACRLGRQWQADWVELGREGMVFALQAHKDFDATKGTAWKQHIRGVVKLRLLDKLKHEMGAKFGDSRRRPGVPLFHLRDGRRRRAGCRDVVLAKHKQDENLPRLGTGDKAVWNDPSRPVLLAEAVDAVRRCLSPCEIEILRYWNSGMKTKEIADKVGVAVRTAQKYLEDIKKCLKRHWPDTGLSQDELAKLVWCLPQINSKKSVALLNGSIDT